MALPPDPELKPVAAAQAELDRLAAPAAAKAGPRRPVIEPLDPAQWEVRYTLVFPLKVDGQPLTTISPRAITTGEMSRLIMEDDDEATVSLRARALACGLHPDVFAALSAVDGAALAELLRPLLPAGLVAAEDELADAVAGTSSPPIDGA